MAQRRPPRRPFRRWSYDAGGGARHLQPTTPPAPCSARTQSVPPSSRCHRFVFFPYGLRPPHSDSRPESARRAGRRRQRCATLSASADAGRRARLLYPVSLAGEVTRESLCGEGTTSRQPATAPSRDATRDANRRVRLCAVHAARVGNTPRRRAVLRIFGPASPRRRYRLVAGRPGSTRAREDERVEAGSSSSPLTKSCHPDAPERPSRGFRFRELALAGGGGSGRVGRLADKHALRSSRRRGRRRREGAWWTPLCARSSRRRNSPLRSYLRARRR